jgi:ribosomal protein S18 acetylase RimI-like enzyme
MWVDPAWRRRGIGQALLQAVFGWAREHGLKRLALWAPAHRRAAIALYRRAGFRKTGEQRPLPSNATLTIVAMEVEL